MSQEYLILMSGDFVGGVRIALNVVTAVLVFMFKWAFICVTSVSVSLRLCSIL